MHRFFQTILVAWAAVTSCAASELWLADTTQPIPTSSKHQTQAAKDAEQNWMRAKAIDGEVATQWLYEAGWGVWMHYLDHSLLNQHQPWSSQFQSRVTPEACKDLGTNPEKLQLAIKEWNQIVDGFNVKELVRQLQEVKAGYLIFTLGQVGGFYCSPNATLDAETARIAPGISFCSKRDLIAELADELARANIRLIVYVPNEIPPWNPVIRQAFAVHGDTRNVFQNQEAYARWESVLSDWSHRFGTNAAGWWIDNPLGIADYAQTSVGGRTNAPVWKTLATALRAGNPHAILTLAEWPAAPGSRWPISDFGSGERWPGSGQHVCAGRWINNVQWFSEAGLYAFDASKRTYSTEPVWSGAQAGAETRAIIAKGGTCAYDVAYNLDGTISPSYFAALKTIAQTLAKQPVLRAYEVFPGNSTNTDLSRWMLDIYRPKLGEQIRYTLDGSEPGVDSRQFVFPLEPPADPLRKACTLKARVFLGAVPVGETFTAVFKPRDVMRGCIATASSNEPGHGPEKAVDGDTSDLKSSWRATPYPQWLQVELQNVVRLKAVHFWPYWNGNRYYRYTVDISADGIAWKLIADKRDNSKPATPTGEVLEFPPQEARFIRVNMLSNSLNQGVHIVELKAVPDGD